MTVTGPTTACMVRKHKPCLVLERQQLESCINWRRGAVVVVVAVAAAADLVSSRAPARVPHPARTKSFPSLARLCIFTIFARGEHFLT